MCDEINRDEASLNKNENLKAELGAVSGGGSGGAGNVATNSDVGLQELPRMYGGTDVVADTRDTGHLAELSSHSNETARRNLINAFILDDSNNANAIAITDDDPSRYMSRVPTKPKPYDYPVVPAKYDFQNLGTALPLVLMPTTTVAAPAPVNPIPPPPATYYTFNDPNSWRPNFAGETATARVPNSDYFISNADGNSDDYFYPIVCGTRNNNYQMEPTQAANRWAGGNRYADTSSLGVGYAAAAPSIYVNNNSTPSQQWVIPYNNGNYYTSLQPQNFYTNLTAPGVPPGIPPQFVCKRDCTPTTRFPTTRCTRRPGSPVPVIAWENNNTCCCELCGITCKAQFNRGKGPMYGPCKPAPQPMPNNRNALYCHGRRRKREYYLSAPKARQRLQRESDRCRMTTTTTPKPKPWPTNYPIKFKLQKSIDANDPLQTTDAGIPVANQVSNVPMSPSAADQLDKILVFENPHNSNVHSTTVNTNNKIQVVRPTKTRTKNVTETASSKLRKKHNEIRMQELQETLEIALEKMNQEIINE